MVWNTEMSLKKKKKNSAHPQKACRWEVRSDSLRGRTRVQGPGVKQSHTHTVSGRRGPAVLTPSLFLLPYASLINRPSVLIPSFHSAWSFPSCGGPQDKVGPLLGNKREVVGRNNMHPESRCQLSITQGHQTTKEDPGIFFNYVNDESRLLLRPFRQNS